MSTAWLHLYEHFHLKMAPKPTNALKGGVSNSSDQHHIHSFNYPGLRWGLEPCNETSPVHTQLPTHPWPGSYLFMWATETTFPGNTKAACTWINARPPQSESEKQPRRVPPYALGDRLLSPARPSHGGADLAAQFPRAPLGAAGAFPRHAPARVALPLDRGEPPRAGQPGRGHVHPPRECQDRPTP